ncbi:MAG: aminotransferase class I/II-fold pyridoxal phosphate-dependent enzyme [Alphaproteobacteria bacterium]|nr:aminotransferase class I/II-fold pyridoxal phosphate-dependent enzyme [Alphaproteobacteria bacterium]
MTTLRLHLNESPTPPSPRAVAAMQTAAADVHRYPDNDPAVLAAALSASLGVRPGRLVFANGSSELLLHAAQLVLRPGDEAVVPIPSFPLYEKAIGIQHGRAVGVPTTPDGRVDVPAMLAAIGPRCRLVYAATPNNPTGGLLDAAAIDALAQGVPDDVLLLLDEAYYEFGRDAGGPETLPILGRRRGPWIATRTFSKAHGLAGIRIGYGIAQSTVLADRFRSLRLNFTLNHVAQAGALAALADDVHTRSVLASAAVARAGLAASLSVLGFDVFPSATNFVTARTREPAARLVQALAERGILVMPFAWPGAPNVVRISVGSPDDVAAVLTALRDILGPAAGHSAAAE